MQTQVNLEREAIAVRLRALLVLRHTEAQLFELRKMIALRRVTRGAYYLQSKAPRGWFLNCINIHEGGPFCRIRMGYTGESVLCLAFEHELECWVLEKIGLSKGAYFERKCFAESHGLFYEAPQSHMRNKPLHIPAQMLNEAWEEFLLRRIPNEWMEY